MMNCKSNGPQKRIEEIGDICDRSNSIDLLQKFFSSNSGAGGTPTPQEKMAMSGMGILPVLATASKRFNILFARRQTQHLRKVEKGET